MPDTTMGASSARAMGVIRRYLFPSALYASLLACAFFSTMWVRGLWVSGPGMVGFGVTLGDKGPTRFAGLAPGPSSVAMVAMTTAFPVKNRTGWFRDPGFVWNLARAPHNRTFSRALGFDTWRNHGPFGSMMVVALPYWLLVMASAALPAWYVTTRALWRRAHGRAGCCARCGYDLRTGAPAGPCPKCGAAPKGAFEVRLATPATTPTPSHA
jgi:hypothetical protein